MIDGNGNWHNGSGGKKSTGWNAAQLEAIELLALEPGMTQDAIAQRVGVTPKTLWTWRKMPDFQHAVVTRAREVFKDKVPGCLNALSRVALEGDVQAIKLALQVTGLVDPEGATTVNLNNYRLRWRLNDDSRHAPAVPVARSRSNGNGSIPRGGSGETSG